MKHIKLYEEFVFESSRNIIDEILTRIEPTIREMVEAVKAAYIKNNPLLQWTPYDDEITRLNLVCDLVKAVERYTKSNDVLVIAEPRKSRKGNIEIYCKIERDGVAYDFNTEVIYAGGYNIQRLHYRYITSTNLPKTDNSEVTKVYQEKIKRLSKAEKLNKELENLEQRIIRNREEAEENSKLSDEEIWKELQKDPKMYVFPSWEEIVKRDAAKNYDNDESKYRASETEYKANKIKFWKLTNIQYKLDNIKYSQSEIVKINKKLQQIVDSNK
jgi:hypothetical protein